MSDRQYLINNQWLSYDEAHNLYGMTILKPQIIALYTSDLDEVSVRKDVTDNTYYDSIAKSWVSDISLLSERLFLRLDESKLYKGSLEISSGFTFSDSIVNASPDYIDYNYSIVSIEDIKENYGITNYKCSDYIVQDGELLAWYDSKTDMYWDNRPDKKEWTSSPPEIVPEVQNQDIYIAPSTTSIVLQDYNGIQPVFSYFRSDSFPEQDLYFEDPAEMKTGFQIYPEFEYFYDKVYDDDISYNISLYVDSEDGITSPHTHQHFQYCYAFTGDLAKVWVDSDEDVTFYRENRSYIFGKTHDEYHDESNPLYWCDDTYKTMSQLHDEGYSTLPTALVEILDSSTSTTLNGWFIISNGNIYYNDKWYTDEPSLNSDGYYIVT